MFANPTDGGEPITGYKHYWHRTGDGFESLTLGPSIDASDHGQHYDNIQTPCWHGFIRNGEVTNAD
jgi:hypothetical protein